MHVSQVNVQQENGGRACVTSQFNFSVEISFLRACGDTCVRIFTGMVGAEHVTHVVI